MRSLSSLARDLHEHDRLERMRLIYYTRALESELHSLSECESESESKSAV